MQRSGYRIIPVNPRETEVLGETCYPDLDSIPGPVDIVDIFRRSEFVPEIVEAAIRKGAKVIWMQEGVVHEAAARRAWDKAKELMAYPELRLLLLDELNIALRYEHLPLDEVVAALRGRRDDLHILVTGRNAKPELIAAADLVTEMTLIKHHFAAGVKAQEGIEF